MSLTLPLKALGFTWVVQ